ncbi:MAG: hypothetical protein ABI383_16385 [Acidobacteriaceae bacterium]
MYPFIFIVPLLLLLAWLVFRRRAAAYIFAVLAAALLLHACSQARPPEDTSSATQKQTLASTEPPIPPPPPPQGVTGAPPPPVPGVHHHKASSGPASVPAEGPTAAEQQETIDAELTNFYNQPANGLYRISQPEELTVGDSATVVVELRGVQALTVTPPPLQSGPNVQESGDKVRVSDQMSVKMVSEEAGAFEVKSAESASDEPIAKTLPPNYFASWRWNVKALKAGTYHLHVFVYLPHPIAGADLAPSVVYDRMQPPIVVSAVPLIAQAKNTIVDTLKGHWLDILKWAWLALFVPLGHFLWKRMRGSKAGADAEKADAKKTGA